MYQNRIREIRTQKGLSLTHLANLSGITAGYLCHLEQGTRKNPSIIVMEQIAKVLNKSVTEIFFK